MIHNQNSRSTSNLLPQLTNNYNPQASTFSNPIDSFANGSIGSYNKNSYFQRFMMNNKQAKTGMGFERVQEDQSMQNYADPYFIEQDMG